ncbi:MAG: hypothetical protein KatS3mg110_3299 [Pirellulaceae bacterium]|nr:MAG: hypothetical protein KatS3mg110_3299 [Pirellulaceae bacterium]
MPKRIVLVTEDSIYRRLVDESDLPGLFHELKAPEELLIEPQPDGCVRISLDWFQPDSPTWRSLGQAGRETILGRLGDDTCVCLVVLPQGDTLEPSSGGREGMPGREPHVGQCEGARVANIEAKLASYWNFRKYLEDALANRACHVRHVLVVVAERELLPEEENVLFAWTESNDICSFRAVFLMTRCLERDDRQRILHASYIWPYAVGTLLLAILQSPALEDFHGVNAWRGYRLTMELKEELLRDNEWELDLLAKLLHAGKPTFSGARLPELPEPTGAADVAELWQKHVRGADGPWPEAWHDLESQLWDQLSSDPAYMTGWAQGKLPVLQQNADAMQSVWDEWREALTQHAAVTRELLRWREAAAKKPFGWWKTLWPVLAGLVLGVSALAYVELQRRADTNVAVAGAVGALVVGWGGLALLGWRRWLRQRNSEKLLRRQITGLRLRQARLALRISTAALKLRRQLRFHAAACQWRRRMSDIWQSLYQQARWDPTQYWIGFRSSLSDWDQSKLEPKLIQARDIRAEMNWSFLVDRSELVRAIEGSHESSFVEWLREKRDSFVIQRWRPYWQDVRQGGAESESAHHRWARELAADLRQMTCEATRVLFTALLRELSNKISDLFADRFRKTVFQANYLGFASTSWPSGYQPDGRPKMFFFAHERWPTRDRVASEFSDRIGEVRAWQYIPDQLPLVGLLFERLPLNRMMGNHRLPLSQARPDRLKRK